MPKTIAPNKHLIAGLLLSGFSRVHAKGHTALNKYYYKYMQITPTLKTTLYVKIAKLNYIVSYADDVRYIQKPISKNSLNEILNYVSKNE